MAESKKPFSIKNRLKSFKYAFNGLRVLFKDEHNARIHLFVTIIVFLLGLWLDISGVEWLVILLLIAIVFSLEIINSSIERICDYLSPKIDDRIKKIKDLSSAAVLVSAIISVVCGLIIFVPKLLSLL